MSTRNTDWSKVPDWPAAMRRSLAAKYLDLGEASFIREVFDGRLPAPFILGGREHWSKAQIDRAIAVLSGEVVDYGEVLVNGKSVNEWTDGSPLYEDWRKGTEFER